MKVQKEVVFQPVTIVLEKPEKVENFLKMYELCSESLGKDSFSQFSRNLRDRSEMRWARGRHHRASE